MYVGSHRVTYCCNSFLQTFEHLLIEHTSWDWDCSPTIWWDSESPLLQSTLPKWPLWRLCFLSFNLLLFTIEKSKARMCSHMIRIAGRVHSAMAHAMHLGTMQQFDWFSMWQTHWMKRLKQFENIPDASARDQINTVNRCWDSFLKCCDHHWKDVLSTS